jgi:hypothetical protein
MAQYMLMMHVRRDEVADAMAWEPDDLRRMIEFQRAFDQDLVDSGEMVFNAGLAWPDQARIVRDDHGAVSVADGPFTVDRDFLIGFWVVECASEARAFEIAAKASSSPGPGGASMAVPIEVRPLAGPPPVES